MRNHLGAFRGFFSTLAAATFLAMTLSSCAVTVALPGGGSTAPPIKPPTNIGAGTGAGASGGGAPESKPAPSEPTPEEPKPEEPKDEKPTETPKEENKEKPKEEPKEDPAPAPSPAKWSPNGRVLMSYTLPDDFNGTLVLPTDRSYTIATNAFSKENKQKIRKLVVPSNVVEIEISAFSGCPYLAEVVFEGTSIILKKAVFQNCNNLRSVTLPQQLQDIPEYLFSGCTQLNTIKLSENLQTIGKSAFEKCFVLSNITFPETLKVIGSHAFQGAGLTSVTFPRHISTIGEEAFYQNQSLLSVEFSGETNPAEFGTRLFANCTSLKTVVLRGIITSLPSEIFSSTSIETLYIPATVIDISDTAFDYDTPPKKIYFAGSQSEWNTLSEALYWSEEATVVVKYGESAPCSDSLSLLSDLLSIF